MSEDLTEGGVEKLYSTSSIVRANLQAINVGKLSNGNLKVIRLGVSDGKYFTVVLLNQKEHLQELILKEDFINSIIETETLRVSQKGNYKILIQDVVVKKHLDSVVGSPIKYSANSEENSADASKDAKELGSPAPKGPPQSSPASTPPKVEASSLPLSQPSVNRVPIAMIHPYGTCNVKAKLISKEDVRRFKGRNNMDMAVFSAIILDDSSDMKVTFWNEQCEKYYDSMEVGKWYVFSKGSFKVAQSKYNNTKCQYEMTVSTNTTIERCLEEDAPQVRFDFVSIDKLATMIAKWSNRRTWTSLEWFKKSRHLEKSQSSREGTAANKKAREMFHWWINPAKQSASPCKSLGSKIFLDSPTANRWDNHAEEFDTSHATNHSILAVRGARVSDYNGCSLSTLRSSMLQINPDTPEAKDLREWYSNCDAGKSFQPVAEGGQTGKGPAGPAPRKLIEAVAKEALGSNTGKADIFTIKGYVTYSNTEKQWQYPANPENKKKVVASGDVWIDESTGTQIDTCQRRYISTFAFMDLTGRQWLTCFDEHAQMILGKSADELYELECTDKVAFEGVWKAAYFKEYMIKVRAKAEEYKGETRAKYSVMSLEPVNYVTESQHLISEIRRYLK
eukprot:763411-Hanusia_phi.AAC.1